MRDVCRVVLRDDPVNVSFCLEIFLVGFDLSGLSLCPEGLSGNQRFEDEFVVSHPLLPEGIVSTPYSHSVPRVVSGTV